MEQRALDFFKRLEERELERQRKVDIGFTYTKREKDLNTFLKEMKEDKQLNEDEM